MGLILHFSYALFSLSGMPRRIQIILILEFWNSVSSFGSLLLFVVCLFSFFMLYNAFLQGHVRPRR